ncbi:MAG: serine/threonine protein kinase [Erythrobacter sp.]|uniref:serine/threonine-protein kinase n=1 Tax=Erythrobacter sp. TaxID=1042 RepID=UPI0025E0F312|nr:serine/threonine-protein kinase [Erythrobacter sp.]MCL9998756.1 serine/threonine protein kinase [Erythrobacter sp.]
MAQMDSGRWEAIMAAFDRIAPLDAGERAAALAGLAPGIAPEVERMLAAAELTGVLDGGPLGIRGARAPQPAALAEGTRVGGFVIDRLIGRGGMGEVYLATRDDPSFRQQVALKLLRIDMAVDEKLFARERRMLARLDHPHIAHFIDGGVTPEGRLWMAMAYVEGETIGAWVARTNPSLEARLAVFRQVCEAAAHAHANLIVHRDIKPSNILIDRQGRARLLDFGVASLAEDPERSGITGGVLTLHYASPEQLTAGPVTVATDVHALGLVLYTLLADTQPWGDSGSPLSTLVRRIVEDEVRGPSRAEARGPAAIPPARLAGDLDAIVLKALRKDPAERYPGVAALLADLDAYAEFRPVAARRATTGYRVKRFLRRYRWQTAAAAALLAVLTGGIIATTRQANIAEAERDRALAEARRADSIVQTLTLALAQGGSSGDLTFRQTLDQTAQRLLATLDGSERSGATANAIADLYIFVQDAKAAQAFLDRAVSKGIGKDSPVQTARLKASLADTELFTSKGERVPALLDEAEALLPAGSLAAEEVREAIIGTRASMARRSGDLDKALALIGDLDRAERAFGGNQSQLMVRYNNLLVYLIEGNRLAEADAVFARADRLLAKSGQGDTIQALGLDQLRAAVLMRTDRNSEAGAVLRRLIERRRRLYGESPALASDLSLYSRQQLAEGQYAAAEAAANESRPMLARFMGDAAPPVVMQDLAIAQILAEQGKLGPAQAQLALVDAAAAAIPPLAPQLELTRAIVALAARDTSAARTALAKAEAGFTALGPAGTFGLQGVAKVRARLAKLP